MASSKDSPVTDKRKTENSVENEPRISKIEKMRAQCSNWIQKTMRFVRLVILGTIFIFVMPIIEWRNAVTYYNR